MGRREFLKGAAVLAAAGAIAPQLAVADADGARPEHVALAVPGLHPAHDGLRVAHLTDLHVGPRTPVATLRAAIDEVERFEPDLVVLTGDYVSNARQEVGLVRELLGGLGAPTFAVLGNHDHWVDGPGTAAALRAHGYEVLSNAWTRVHVRGEPLAVVGVDDLLTGHADAARALRGLPAGSPPLVLAHGPKTARRIGRAALCFAGHTHGGQIYLPLLTPLLIGGVMREPYLRGRYALGEVQLYVSRGVGNSGVRVRVNAPAEVTLATLRRA
jgi:predicted MPP superfamily phosphohydrolase